MAIRPKEGFSMRTGNTAVAVVLCLAAPVLAQDSSWRFHWRTGQVLPYRVEHVTTSSEVVNGNKVVTSSKLTVLKHWQVLDVDAQGVATLQLSLAAMRNEQVRPSGETLVFDSANPEKSTPELRTQLAKYVGTPLAVLRVDGFGRVLEVKQGPASRYESEPPFIITLPATLPAVGQSWERAYKLTLDPPLGTGEKYDAVQKFVLSKSDAGQAVMQLTTELRTLPENATDRLPLLQKLPAGEVTFDARTGRLQRARLRIDQQLQGHNGAGSSYRFQSTYTEEYAGQP
jgi:hypothetical protein